MASELNEAQAQQQLDELSLHVESAFSRYFSNLDSVPDELDGAAIDEVLDEVERSSAYARENGPGNNVSTSSDLSGSYGLAHLNAEGKVFVVTNPVHNNYSGKIKIWGKLEGRQAFKVVKLPFGYFTIVIIGLKGGCTHMTLIYLTSLTSVRQYISTKREPKIKPEHGFGKWE